MPRYEIHSCEQMIELIQQLGFLPLLVSGISGYSAEEMADEECRYVVFPEGGWDWPLWKWKGIIINESDCVYGKFFNGKAGFISRSWWRHFCNWRRSLYPMPEDGSIEGIIYQTLCEQDSIINRDLGGMWGSHGEQGEQIAATETSKNLGTRALTSTDFLYSGSSAKILADSTGV